jgi:hypothetical protein
VDLYWNGKVGLAISAPAELNELDIAPQVV